MIALGLRWVGTTGPSAPRYTPGHDGPIPSADHDRARKVTKIVEQLCGLQVTSTQVSRAAAELDEELAAWRNRPLGEVTYLILDARYEKVRHGGAVVPCAVLTAIGITAEARLGSPQ